MTQVAFSRPPSYQWWMNESTTGVTMFGSSPRTYIELPMNYSRMVAGKVYAMQVTSFNIEAPPAGETRGAWDPESGDDPEKTDVGKIVLSPNTMMTDTPCWTSLSQSVMVNTWYSPQNDMVVAGTFHADTGDFLQSTPTLITAPVNNASMGIILVGGKSSGFLTNKNTASGALAPLDGYSMCISYWSLTDTEIAAYCPYGYNRFTSLPVTVYETTVAPVPPLQLLSFYQDASTPAAAIPSWLGLKKTPGGNSEYWLSLGGIFLNNSSGGTYQLVADFYNSIADATQPTPALAFAGLTPAYTTPITTDVADTAGSYLPFFFGANYDNALDGGSIDPVYMVIREVEGNATPDLNLLMTVGTTDPPGGAGGGIGSIGQVVYGSAVYYT